MQKRVGSGNTGNAELNDRRLLRRLILSFQLLGLVPQCRSVQGIGVMLFLGRE